MKFEKKVYPINKNTPWFTHVEMSRKKAKKKNRTPRDPRNQRPERTRAGVRVENWTRKAPGKVGENFMKFHQAVAAAAAATEEKHHHKMLLKSR